jgi:hypothetical protein
VKCHGSNLIIKKWDRVVGCCEHGNEPSVSIKDVNFEQLSDILSKRSQFHVASSECSTL